VTSEPDECLLLAGGIRDNAHRLAGGCWRELGKELDEVVDLSEAEGSFRRFFQGQSD
jgi:hypothetical protein